MNNYSQVVAISFILVYCMMIEPARARGIFNLHLAEVNFTEWRRPRSWCSKKTDSPLQCAQSSFVVARVCFTVFDREFLKEQCIFGNSTVELSPTPSKEDPLPKVNRDINYEMVDRWIKDFSLVFDIHVDDKKLTKLTSGTRVARYNALHNDITPSQDWYTVMREVDGVKITYIFRFQCDTNYYGSDCKTRCQPRNGTHGHYNCSPEGKRVCHHGWSGDYCTIAKCGDDCHMVCESPNVNCRCEEGWEGPQCNKCSKSEKCVNGFCLVNTTGIKPCECHPDWGGHNCDIDLHFCGHHKDLCKHGSCYNTQNPSLKHLRYTCKCDPGYWGINCELRQCNSSHPTPCLHGGKCMQDGLTNAWRCVCPASYFGSFCELNATQCAARHCPVSGTACQTDINDTRIRCVCPPGQRCGNKVDYCAANPCENGGKCESMDNGFRCSCPAGMSGNRCQFNLSACNLSCRHGGQCRHTATRIFCDCPVGFTGALCECPPCVNGYCINVPETTEFRCVCQTGYYGHSCNRSHARAPNFLPTNFPQLQSIQPSLTIFVVVGAVCVVAVLFMILYGCRKLYRHRRRANQANNYIKNNCPTSIQNDLGSTTHRPDSPIPSATVHPKSAALTDVKKPLDDKLDHHPPKIHNTADQSVNLLSDPSPPVPPNLGAGLNTGPNSGIVWPLSPSLPNGKKTAVFLSSPERRRQGINWFSSVNTGMTGHATQYWNLHKLLEGVKLEPNKDVIGVYFKLDLIPEKRDIVGQKMTFPK